jgi:hypothetical protein
MNKFWSCYQSFLILCSLWRNECSPTLGTAQRVLNVRASLFNDDLSSEHNLGWIHLAGQYF